MAMIHPRRLAQLVMKWQKVKNPSSDDEACCTTSPTTDRCHCAMYTADGRRFKVPLMYLNKTVVGELLRMSQEEFGFTCEAGSHCFDVAVMEYAMCLLRRNASEEVERAFLSSVVTPCQYTSCTAPPGSQHQQLAVCSS